MSIKDIKKIESIKQNYKKKCMWCGHTVSFYAFEPTKKLCSYCHRYTYKNEKEKFIHKLQNERRKIK